jgi:hypothetical protein
MRESSYFFRIQVGIIIPILFIFFQANGYSQSATTTSGGDAKSSDGSVSYSVGQTSFISQTSEGGSVNAGVQQTYAITKSEIHDYKYSFALEVFPNPTTQNLTLKIEETNFVGLKYRLLDLQGKLIEEKIINSSETNIETKLLISSTYILNIEKSDQTLQSFKIIKE